jgi:DNA gyrase subunit A
MPRKSAKQPKKTDSSKKETKLATTDRVQPLPIVEEMQKSYLDYAMSVIVARALPDARDGLKPVHRRILYTMWESGLKSNAKFRKSANVVGGVMAHYHPHGDSAIYDSLARMAQDFSMRYPLVNGQGNFGSMDGDAPAAMRYTEAKLASLAEEMLYDIDKDTVNFVSNYDGAKKEPQVLPAKLPQLLLNGTVGIAVGMATNIPPHNLGELIAGIKLLIEKPNSSIDDLVKLIPGPDFPTGAQIFDQTALKEAYATGRGKAVVRAVANIEEAKRRNDEFDIIVTELPYQVNKANLLEKIADLVKTKKIEGIRDLRDESDRDGVRVVIELKKASYPKKILNQLYKHTQLQDTFHFNMLALVDGLQPRVLNLKSALEEFIKHRQVVVKRRTEFDLTKAKDRAHILDGLMLALNKIDAVIKTIKAAKDNDDAKSKLVKKFKLTEVQAQAILEMRLRQLASLERLKIETELKEKRQLIKDLTALLKSQEKMNGLIQDELKEIDEKYSDERRTKIIPHEVDSLSQEDLIPDEATIVTLTQDGFIKRLPPETFRTQARGGKGVVGLSTREQDSVEHFFSTTTHKDILFFTNRGRVFQLKAYEVPVASRTAKGQSIVNFLSLAPEEKVSSVLALNKIAQAKYLIMVTKNGVVKKVELKQFKNVRRSGLIAIRLKTDDLLEWVSPTSDKRDIMLVTKAGLAIRFKEQGLRHMGRPAAGVRGVKLKKDDEVVGMCIINTQDTKLKPKILVVTENGYGKMTAVKEYRSQTRGGTGIKTAAVTSKTGSLVASFAIDPQNLPEDKKGDLIIISEKGQVIRLPLKSVSTLGRSTQGVRLMKFKESGDRVASVTLV